MIGVVLVGLAAAAPATWVPAHSLVGVDESFGTTVVSGDLDCDGWPELVVGSPYAEGGDGPLQGRAQGFAGTPDGWSAATIWEKWGSVDGRLAEALAIGDVDHDGCADLAIGEPGRADGRGAVVLFHGSPLGIPLDPPSFSTTGAAPDDGLGLGLWLLDGPGGGLLYGVPGWGDDEGIVALHPGAHPDALGWVWTGVPRSQLGWSLTVVDLEGSGEPWLVAGAPAFDNGVGRVHLLPPDGDVPAEEFVEGDRYDARFGERVASLGDTIGDGRHALGVCAPGPSGGAGQLTVWTLDAGALTHRQTLDGPEAGARFCTELLGNVDLDADGWPDLAVSVRNRSETWLYYGGADGFEGPAVVLPGGGGLAALGDWNADGYDDLVVGVPDDQRVDVYLGRPDADHDGVQDADDCDPLDPDVGASEMWFLDADADGYGRSDTTVETCAPPVEGHSAQAGDCDDTDPRAHPGREEVVGDGIDQDCDGVELCFVDADGDGFRVPDAAVVPASDPTCADAGLTDATAPDTDCDDTLASVHPDAYDWPDDGLDQDCDGADAALRPPSGDWQGGCSTGASRHRLGFVWLAIVLGLFQRRGRWAR